MTGKLRKYWANAVDFIMHDLWTPAATRTSGSFRMLVRMLRVIVLMVKGFYEDDLPVHASALTFASLMSLIPLLAIILSVLQGIGVGNERIDQMMDWVGQMPVEFQEFVDSILEVAQKTNFAALGVVGLITLLLFATMVLSGIENTFNRIWGITKARNVIRRTMNYISIIAVVPILVAVSGATAAFLGSPVIVARLGLLSAFYSLLLRSMPYMLTWLALYLLYTALPNTRVRIRPALFASLLGAIGLLAWQAIYISFQVGVVSRNAIYGTFATIPIFMTWLYFSWFIVLVGAKMAFALQNEATLHLEQFSEKASLQAKVTVTLAVLVHCARALEGEEEVFDASSFAENHHVPVRLLNEICRQLVSAGWLTERNEAPGSYTLMRSPARIQVRDIFAVVLSHGASPKSLGIDHLSNCVDLALDQFDRGIDSTLHDETLGMLLGMEESQDKPRETGQTASEISPA